MTALPARFFAPEAPRAPVAKLVRTWRTVVGAELLVRLRDSNMVVLLACVAAACVLMTPAADANYAVITFGGMKPIMSAGTTVAAAGAVFSVFMFPVYLLGLGIGCVRDRRSATGAILATTPIDPASISGARLMANAILVTVFSLLVLFLVIIVVASRLHAFPDAISLGVYVLVVIPAALCALPLGALADRYLGDRDGAKVTLAFSVWIGLMLCSLLADSDAFGLRLLKENAPAGSASDWSLGFISAKNMLTIPWQVVSVSGAFVMERLSLAIAAIVMCALAAFLVSPGMMSAISAKQAHAAAGLSPGAAPATASVLPRIRPATSGVFKTALILTRSWLSRTKWLVALIASGFSIALFFPQGSRVALSVALIVPLLIANNKRLAGSSSGRYFERTTAAFWRPSPLLFTGCILGAVTALPALPLLLQLPLMRSLHVLLAMLAAALWLTWTCSGMGRRLLGISVYALIWYLGSFSDIPPALDLFALRGTAVPSFVAALGLVTMLAVFLFRMDSYEYGSSERNF